MRRVFFTVVMVVYNLLTVVVAVLWLPWLYLASRFGSSDRSNLQRAGLSFRGAFTRRGSIWVHAVSVGEVCAATPLIEGLAADYPVALSVGTEAGQRVARSRFGTSVDIFRMPLDAWPLLVAPFRMIRPRALVVLETEIWPTLVLMAAHRNVPVFLANARMPPRDLPRYRATSWFWRTVFAFYRRILAQSDLERLRFLDCGAPEEKVIVSGNTKYDTSVNGAGPPPESMRALFETRPTDRCLVIIGSTHHGEDEKVMEQLSPLKDRLQFVVVPRHPSRARRVEVTLQRLGLAVARQSSRPATWREDVVIWDTFGDLAALYSFADIVLIGGSWVPHGGHNVMEPASRGKAIVTGPYLENFRETADRFLKSEALLVVDAPDLAPIVAELAADPARRRAMGRRALDCVLEQTGATDVCVAEITSTIRRTRPPPPAGRGPGEGGSSGTPRSRSAATRARHRVEYHALRLAVCLVGLLPWRHNRRLALALYPLCRPLVGRIRRATLANVRASDLALPASGRALSAFLRETLLQMLITCVETVRLAGMDGDQLARHIAFADPESPHRAVGKGPGLIVVMAHLANWELVGRLCAHAGFPIHTLARRQDNPLTDEFLNRARRHGGIVVLFRKEGSLARRVTAILRAHGVMTFLVDQNAGRRGVRARLLGRWSSAPRGPALFALKTGAPVCIVYGVRGRDGRHTVHVDEPFFVRANGRSAKDTVEDATHRIVARLDEIVRQHPEQWFWFLDRWRADRIRGSRPA